MTEPFDRLRRRPLLAPLLLPLLVLLAAGAGIYWLGSWARTTVVVLVRHAEPQPITGGGDPDLSIAGERRVAALGEFLADLFVAGKVDHLYAADTRRAQQTAAPIANQFGLPINLLASNDWPTLARRIKSDHRGETVVVVGYSSTLPVVVEQLAGANVEVGEDEFDSVFVVVMPSPGDARVLRLHYEAQREPTTAATDK
jgi:2,3-bisphosphoglycerate-dependent phosphoglycerate mutase